MITVGQTYRIEVDVVDEDGVPAVPESATCAITLPDLSTTTAGVTRGTTCYADYVPSKTGIYAITLTTVAPGASVTEYPNVREYISMISESEARQHLGDQSSPSDLIRFTCAAATRLTEQKVGTVVPRLFTDDEIPGRYRPWLLLPHGPPLARDAVTSIKSVWPDGQSFAAGDLIVSMQTAKVRRADGLPFMYGPWLSTYKAGRAPVSENITAGCKQILWDLWGELRGLTRDTDLPDITDLPAIEAGYQLSPLVKELLGGELLAITGFA